MTDGTPPPQPDGEDDSTIGASETDSEQELGEIAVPSTEPHGLPMISDVAGLEDLYTSTNELDAYREPAVVDMSALGSGAGRAGSPAGNAGDDPGPAEDPDGTVEEWVDVDDTVVSDEPADADRDSGKSVGVDEPVAVDEQAEADESLDVDESTDVAAEPSSEPGLFSALTDLVRSTKGSPSADAGTIFERWPEPDFDPAKTQPVDPATEQPGRPAVVTPALKLSTEAAPVPSVQWSTVVHEPHPSKTPDGRGDQKEVSDVPSPRPPARAVRGPGQLRKRPMAEALAEAAERRWFWATVSGAAAVVFAIGLTASNLIPNPFQSSPTADVVTDAADPDDGTDPAAPATQVESTTGESEPGSTTGAESSTEPQTSVSSSASSTSGNTTTTRRRTTTHTHASTSSKATTTQPASTTPSTTDQSSTSTTDGSSTSTSEDTTTTTDGSTSSTDSGSSTSDGSSSSTSESTTTTTDGSTTTVDSTTPSTT